MRHPTVSIVIPASDAVASIADALRAALAQDYSAIAEVVVSAADAATAEAARLPGVTVIPNPSGTTPAALNIAIAATTGDVIVRIDAHSIVPPDYVTRAVTTLEETNAANVGGMQVPVGTRFWERAIAAAMSSSAGSGDARYRIGGAPGPVDTVYLGVFRRSLLEELGGFDESFRRHQDFELNQRIRAAGGIVWFDPDLRVEYRPRASIGELARQYFGYGTWKRSFARRHPGSLQPRQLAPIVLVVGIAASLALSWVSPWFLLVPAGYSLGLIIAGSLTIREAGSAAVGVPIALGTMHMSWGLGFLFGQTREA
jgi:succinoglycan biosynthesis protein ExoA